MLALLGIIPQILGLGSSITDLFKMKAKAESDKQLREIDKEIEAVRDKRAVLVAEASNKFAGSINAAIRGLMGFSVAAILINMAWDKVAGKIAGCTYKIMPENCHYFKTDPFSEWELAAITTIICFYFVADKFGKK